MRPSKPSALIDRKSPAGSRARSTTYRNGVARATASSSVVADRSSAPDTNVVG
jgi:hypothetical protein